MKIIDERGEVTLANGWRWWKVVMVSIDEAVRVLGVSAHITQAYSLTWTSACVWHNHVDGGGLGFSAIFEDL
jgi:hypothetical protein